MAPTFAPIHAGAINVWGAANGWLNFRFGSFALIHFCEVPLLRCLRFEYDPINVRLSKELSNELAARVDDCRR